MWTNVTSNFDSECWLRMSSKHELRHSIPYVDFEREVRTWTLNANSGCRIRMSTPNVDFKCQLRVSTPYVSSNWQLWMTTTNVYFDIWCWPQLRLSILTFDFIWFQRSTSILNYDIRTNVLFPNKLIRQKLVWWEKGVITILSYLNYSNSFRSFPIQF